MCVGLYYFVFRCSDVKCFSYIMMKTKFLQNKQCIYFVVPNNPNLRTHIQVQSASAQFTNHIPNQDNTPVMKMTTNNLPNPLFLQRINHRHIIKTIVRNLFPRKYMIIHPYIVMWSNKLMKWKNMCTHLLLQTY